MLRLEVIFKTATCSIPINYHYQLCSFVYKRLKHKDRDFESFLHEQGFKGFKMFTFSQLFFDKSAVRDNSLLIWPSGGRWYVSSISEDFLMYFFSSLIEIPQIEIRRTIFPIEQVSLLPEIEFKEEMEFFMLSPLVVSIPVDRNGKLYHKYLFPGDEQFEQVLSKNLIKKYEAFYREKIDGSISIEPDWEYIKKRSKITKLIDINGIKIKGSIFPFKASGDIRLLKIAYEVGFGERNSLGFGMVKTLKDDFPQKASKELFKID
ncbi:MAG: CRISPR-associated endoribonuclease Cas6 [Pseudothermotoga sp.]